MAANLNLIDSLITELQNLRRAKELLDKCLAKYDYYSGEFDNSLEYDKDRECPGSLISEIRHYVKFDDSE